MAKELTSNDRWALSVLTRLAGPGRRSVAEIAEILYGSGSMVGAAGLVTVRLARAGYLAESRFRDDNGGVKRRFRLTGKEPPPRPTPPAAGAEADISGGSPATCAGGPAHIPTPGAPRRRRSVAVVRDVPPTRPPRPAPAPRRAPGKHLTADERRTVDRLLREAGPVDLAGDIARRFAEVHGEMIHPATIDRIRRAGGIAIPDDTRVGRSVMSPREWARAIGIIEANPGDKWYKLARKVTQAIGRPINQATLYKGARARARKPPTAAREPDACDHRPG